MSKRVGLTVRGDGVAVLKMNDTAGKNVFANDFINEIVVALDECETRQPKVLILCGLPDVFSAGAEKKNLLDLADGKVHVKDLLISEKLLNAPFPVIAAMEGHAIGGGFVMALCSDIVLAARESRYGVVFMTLGFTPGMGCTTLLRELVGPFTANEMMYTGRLFKGSELAGRNTDINYILPKTEIMAKAEDIAKQIAEKNRKSVYLLKYALSAPKKKLLIDARLQEDFMHKLSFGFPETRKNIEDMYNE